MKHNHSLEWILQKIFALIFLFLFINTIYFLRDVNLKSYESTLIWFEDFWNSFLVLLLFFSIIFHSNIGLTSIIDDYLHNDSIKKKIILLKNLLLITILFSVTLSLGSILFKI